MSSVLISGLFFLFSYYFFLLVLFPFIKFKTYYRAPTKLIWVGIVLLPVFLQMGILKWNYDEFGISMRSSDTVDFYLMAQCMEQDKGIDLTASRAIITEMSAEERGEYKANHLGLMGANLVMNIQGNIEGDSYMLLHRPEIENAGLRRFMVNMNKVFYRIHQLFIVVLFLFSLLLIWKRSWKDLLLIWVLILPPLFYIVASGVSFSQGDRLVLPALVLWFAAYFLIVYKMKVLFSTQSKDKD